MTKYNDRDKRPRPNRRTRRQPMRYQDGDCLPYETMIQWNDFAQSAFQIMKRSNDQDTGAI